MNHLTSLFSSIFLFLVALLAAATSAYAADGDSAPYRVGVVLPLSGEAASFGRYLRNGIELAQKMQPEDRRASVSFIFEDDKMQPSASVSAFHKLTDVDGVDAVLGVGSAVGNALAPLAESKGKLFIAVAASDKKIAVGRQRSFTHWVSPEAEASLLVSEVERRGHKRLAIIGQQQEGIIAIIDAFDSLLVEKDKRGLIVQRELYGLENRDFRSFLTKARAAKVDGIFVVLLPGALGAFTKQAKSHGITADIFGAETFEDPSEVKASSGTLVGRWYVNSTNGTPAFLNAYRSAYGEHPGIAAANAYDVANLLYDAVAHGQRSSDEVATRLRELRDYEGAAGKYSASGDNRFTLPAVVKIVTTEGFEEVKSAS